MVVIDCDLCMNCEDNRARLVISAARFLVQYFQMVKFNCIQGINA
nr:MAG TPA: hypothetical protein [Caudoviricetes sp.]